MIWHTLPWAELTVLVPLAGSLLTALAGDRAAARRRCLAATLVTLICSPLPWLALLAGGDGGPLLAIDELGAPLVPLVALLCTLWVWSAPRAEEGRFSLAVLLAGEAVQLATFACADPWPLAALLAVGVLPPLAERLRHGRPVRIFALHMGLFLALLFVGVATLGNEPGLASAALMLAVLVRSGTVPAHLWVSDLFEQGPLGSALLFVAPQTAVYAAVRLILPFAPDWALQWIGVASLTTACFAAGLAAVQRDARRLLAYLFLSHASLVLVGLELHTAMSLTGALCLWVSVTLSLAGMGLTLRALEGRFGRLSLSRHHGLYDQSPDLAVCFLLTGLGLVGFPGTLGFVAGDLLIDGAVEASPLVGVTAVFAGAINGIAVLRAYLLVFTGARRESSAYLAITPAKRFAVLTLAALILGGGLLPHPGVKDRYRVAEALLRSREEGLAGKGGEESLASE